MRNFYTLLAAVNSTALTLFKSSKVRSVALLLLVSFLGYSSLSTEVKFDTNKSSTKDQIKVETSTKLIEADLAVLTASGASAEGVRFLDLRGTACYPQPDQLVSCGSPDTLSILVYTKSVDPIGPIDINLELGEGLRYGGFANIGTPDGNMASALDILSTTNLESPIFRLSEVSQANGGVVLHIAIQAICGVDFVANPPSIDLNLFYAGCVENHELAPLSAAPITPEVVFTGTPGAVTITDVETNFCMEQDFTQVTLDAAAGEVTITMSDYGFPEIMLDEVQLGGDVVDPAFITTDPVTGFTSIVLDGNAISSYFGGDGLLDQNELETIGFCFQIMQCPSANIVLPISPTMTVVTTCDGEICGGAQDIEDMATINISPNFGATPVITWQTQQLPAACSSVDGSIQQYIFDIELTSSLSDPLRGRFDNLQFLVDECAGGALGLDSIQIFSGGTSTGALLPLPISGASFNLNGSGRLTIGFRGLLSDPDGPGGLDDLDGDLGFDDLVGGASARVRVYMSPASCAGDCIMSDDNEPKSCQFFRVITQGIRHCNRTMSISNTINPPDPELETESFANFDDLEMIGGSAANPTMGYDFGKFGNTSTGPVTGTIAPNFQYNISDVDFNKCPAPGGTPKLRVVYVGSEETAMNMSLDNAILDGTPIPAGAITKMVSPGSAVFTINAGDISPGLHIFDYEMHLDTFSCGPASTFVLNTQLIEDCPDCQCSPFIRACNVTLVKADPDDYPNCSCDHHGITKSERLNYGYADRTKTTQLTKADFPGDDHPELDNVLPGDQLEIVAQYVLQNAVTANGRTERISFSMQTLQGGSGNIPNNQHRLNVDASSVQSMVVKRGATVFDVGNIPVTGSIGGTYDGITLNGTRSSNAASRNENSLQPGLPAGGHSHGVRNSSNDYQDGNSLIVYFWGEDRVAPGAFNALDGLYNLIGGAFEDLDTIEIVWHVPVILTPDILEDGNGTTGPLIIDNFITRASMAGYDFIPGTTTLSGNFIGGGGVFTGTNETTACIFQDTVNIFNPGVKLDSEITYDEFGCSAEILHEFTIENPIPTDWYQSPVEYRPSIGLERMFTEWPTPYIYSGGSTYELFGDGIGPVASEPDSIMGTDQIGNAHCVTDRYGEMTWLDAERKDGVRDIQYDDFDYANDDWSLSGGTFPLLGVGAETLTDPDTLAFSIPLTRLCTDEAPETPLEGSFEASYTYLADYDHNTYLCNDTRWYDGVSEKICGEKDDSHYWPWKRDSLNNPHRFSGGSTMVEFGTPVPPVNVSINFDDLLLVDGGGGETNIVTICPEAPTTMIPGGVIILEMPSNVTLDASTPAMTFEFNSANGGKVYSGNILDGTAGGGANCFQFELETTLLFCGPDQICLSTVPCPADVELVLAKNLTCVENGCYRYRAGAAELQAGFENPTSPEPCVNQEYEVNFNNTGTSGLTELCAVVYVPGGLDPMPAGTFDLTLNTATGPVITTIPYAEATDLTGVYGTAFKLDMAAMDALLGPLGLEPGESVEIVFEATATCDFVSGSSPGLLVTAEADCDSFEYQDRGQAIEVVDPSGGAEYSLDIQPVLISCEENASNIRLTAINVGKSVSANATICLTLPPELSLVESDIVPAAPDGFTIENYSAIPVGTSGAMQISFDAPDSDAGDFFCLDLGLALQGNAPCGPIDIGFGIKESLEVVCPTQTEPCNMQFLSSEDLITLEVVPNGAAGEATLAAACGVGVVDVTWSLELESLDGEPMSVDIEFFQDIDGNGIVDDYDISVGTATGINYTFASAEETDTQTGTLSIDAEMACPLIAKVDFPTSCACSSLEVPFPEVMPEALANLGESVALCPGEPLVIESCDGLALELSPAAGGTITMNAGMIEVAINDGFGVNAPVQLVASYDLGACSQEFVVNLTQIETLEFPDQAIHICSDGVQQIDLGIPGSLSEDIQVNITPATYLDDATAQEPFLMSPTMDITYTVEYILDNGSSMCSTTAEIVVTVSDPPAVVDLGAEFDCDTREIILTEVGSIMPTGLDGNWSSLGSGTFENGVTQFSTATIYTPSDEDLDSNYVELELVTEAVIEIVNGVPQIVCGPVRDTMRVELYCPDLALKKTLSTTGPIVYGDTLDFEITVYNQGTVFMQNIDIAEYIPCGYTYSTDNDPTWSYDAGTSIASTTLSDVLDPRDSVKVSIELVLQVCTDADAYKNVAEISGMENSEGEEEEDIDSTPDDDPTNDGDMEDNATDGTNDDEDDSDFEIPPIFDLALDKVVLTPTPHAYGQDIDFQICVYNQGTVDATNVVVADSIPAGYMFNAADNTDWSGTPPVVTTTITDVIAPGGMECVIITLVPQSASSSEDYINIGEISEAQDTEGNMPTDADSTPDTNFSDDEGGDVNGSSDNQLDGNGTNDEDDHDPATIQIFDVALAKTTSDMGPFSYGDQITFDITVYNQGTDPIADVLVVDYIACGFIYDPLLNGQWSTTPLTAPTITVSGPIASQDSATVSITLMLQECSTPGAFSNVAEVVSFQDTTGMDVTVLDPDSMGDNNPDNDGTMEDNATDGTNGDEDDSDFELVEVLDLALSKTLSPSQTTPVAIGDDVTFVINVINQGNVTVTNSLVIDYLPSGFALSANDTNGWVDSDMDGNPENTIVGPLAEGATEVLEIVVEVLAASSTDDYINIAEIASTQDENGVDNSDDDADSDPDDNEYNDNGGELGGSTDDTVNNENGDEDDSDPATVPVEYTDLALTKMLAPGQAQQVSPGAIVDFEIEICNQGTIDAYNIGVIDYLPASLIYDDSYGDNMADGWSDIDADGNPEITIPGVILAFGSCKTVIISVEVDPNLVAPASLTNVAEITGSEDVDGIAQTDVDSNPDANDTNDPFGDDNQKDGNGTDDEDDSDPAMIQITDEEIFDLALAKTLAPDQDSPFYLGQDVTFIIEVINQGNVDAYNVEITDAMGASFGLSSNDTNGWLDSDNDGLYELVIPGVILPGESVFVEIVCTIENPPMGPTDLVNVAEISAAEDENGDHPVDVDSDPDSDPTNDPMNPDDNNETEEDGEGGNDEDDHDWEEIEFGTFDLALVKTLSPTQPMPIMPGDDVTFIMKVYNQGTVDAFNIDIVEYSPAGLVLSTNDMNGWVDSNADGNYENTIAGINAGECLEIEIVFTVDPNATGSLMNQAEIADAEDEHGNHPEDTDSTPDDDPNNDPMGDNDQEDGDGTDDEDDHDWEEITLGSWDLALTKQLAPGQSAYIAPGDDVEFVIEVCNQGTMDAYNIDIAEYVPADMSLSTADTNGWTDMDADGVYENTIAGAIVPDACSSINLVLTVDPAFVGTSLTNVAEISDFEDDMGNHPDDNDSTPDDDPSNDGAMEDNATDGENGDEDDSDPEEVFISTGPVYDLALEKDISDSVVLPVYPGEDITFTITVTNQSNDIVQNVRVEDYLPAQLTLSTSDMNGWGDDDTDGYPDITLAGPMAAGAVEMIDITVTIDPSWTGGSLENRAEITDFEDENGDPQDDIDSDTDDIPGDPEDEDDEDGVEFEVEIFDLALVKTFAPGQMPPYMPGTDVTFQIRVINQGTVPAYNVTVDEGLPADLTLSTADTNGWADIDGDGNLEALIAGPIAPGQYEFVNITVTINPAFMAPGSLMNVAEISSAEDENGNMPDDIDSVADSDLTDDATGDNDQEDGDGTDDEDDNDWEELEVFEAMFDLALKKVISPEFSGGLQIGEDIPFDIWVYNQGNVAATNIEVTEHMPPCTAISVNDTNGWTDFDNDNIYEMTNPGPLAPMDSFKFELILTLTCQPDPMGFRNVAEISGADDANGDPIDDIDSVTDGDPSNDAEGDNDQEDGDGTNDEDDHDWEEMPIVDAALVKTTSDVGPFVYGDEVTFDIEIFNQGNVTLTDIKVNDFIPCGYDYLPVNDGTWSFDPATNIATMTIAGPLAEFTSERVSITLAVKACPESPANAWTNVAEIESFSDEDGVDITNEDIDSDGDNDPTNDSTEDNVNDNTDEDEDDNDPETIEIVDLALQKVANPLGPYALGDIGQFDIYVCNQGNTPMYNIEVMDYLPVGLVLDETHPGNAKWDVLSVSESVYISIAGPLLAGECDTISTFVELVSINPMELVNMAEISYMENESGADYSDHDADSRADLVNDDIGNDLFSSLDNVMDQDGRQGGDEDDHDQAFLLTCIEMACHGSINLSIGEMCDSELTPSMLLTEQPYPSTLYEIELKDAAGNDRTGTPFTAADAGMTFTYSISLGGLCNGMSCWGTILVEDKFDPSLTCPGDQFVDCGDIDSAALPSFDDNCGDVTLVPVSEVIEDLCDTEYTTKITRGYKAVDGAGNESEVCFYDIFVRRVELNQVMLAGSATTTGINALSCSDNFATTDEGFPAPSVTGVPTYFGEPIYPNVPDNFCHAFVNFEDTDLGNFSCFQKFTRKWTIVEWHCDGPVTRELFQNVEIKDSEGPVITGANDFTASTTGVGSCEASVTVPSVMVSDACNEPVKVDILYDGGVVLGQNGGLINLPVGSYTVTYRATDDCGNTSTESVNLTVSDGKAPIAICEGFTTLSLNSNGTGIVKAEDLDDGSFDDCGVESILIRKMGDPVSAFASELEYNCGDLGLGPNDTETIVFRVTDTAGNTNECMVQINIADKLPPSVSALADVTVDCDVAVNLSELEGVLTESSPFGIPDIQDNCPSSATVTAVITSNTINQCNNGVITRRITVTDANGASITQTQRITWEPIAPFFINPTDSNDPNDDVEWPQEFDMIAGCVNPDPESIEFIQMFDPAVTGRPVFTEGTCDLVGAAYEDKIFPFNNNAGTDACFKLIRTWTVLDWCQLNDPMYTGPWTYEQVIKVQDNEAPTISMTTGNAVQCTSDNACNGGRIELMAAAVDAICTIELSYTVELDLDDEGVFDDTAYLSTIGVASSGLGNMVDITGDYPVGQHRVRWTFLDRCGNMSFDIDTFTVLNCKAPTPICHDGLTFDLGMDAETEIWASDFDNKSSHPCPDYRVVASFSATDTLEKARTYDCCNVPTLGTSFDVDVFFYTVDDMGNLLYDENGNPISDFCTASLKVTDNSNVCPGISCGPTGTLLVSGHIGTESDDMIESVEVGLESSIYTTDNNTDTTGYYAFSNLEDGFDYDVIPRKLDDVLNGVTTLDLVLIQKHILGKTYLDSPYKMISADINKSNSITAIDLIELRKLILGVYEEYPNNESWRFVDKEYQFGDDLNPWLDVMDENYFINLLSSDMEIDFVGMKIGDVNGSAKVNLNSIETDVKSKDIGLILELEDRAVLAGEQVKVAVTSGNFRNILGFQMGLDIAGQITLVEEGAIDLSQTNVSTLKDKSGAYRISWHDLQSRAVDIQPTIPLFYIEFIADREGKLIDLVQLSEARSSLNAQSYESDGSIHDIKLLERGKDEEVFTSKFELYQNVPNPWSEFTMIKFDIPKDGDVNFKFIDSDGKVILESTKYYELGSHELKITQQEILSQGVILYEMSQGELKSTKKMIKVK